MKHEKKPYFPIFIDLSEKKVVVVGGGAIAKRRIRTLASFTNHLVVLAPDIDPEIRLLEEEGLLTILEKPYTREDIYDADMVLAATNNFQVNNDIHSVCKCMGIPVNVCSDQTKCDFYFPGVIQKDQLVVGVTASGTNHALAKETTQKIREIL
jgi:siroheme synthase-like protein